MYLIVGANGFLGSYLIKNILSQTNENILAADLNCPLSQDNHVEWIKCDITNDNDVEILRQKVDDKNLKILFLAAYHHPDAVLKNPKIAWQINIVALAKFLEKFWNAQMLYYPSTEVVYGETDGQKLLENAPLNPVSRYGEFKRTAESIVCLAGFNVVRFPVLMGESLIDGKKHFTDIIIETMKGGKSMEMFCDQYRTMIDFDSAAKAVIALTQNPKASQYKIVNIAGDEKLSKYEYACRLADKYGLDKNSIKAVHMNTASGIFTEKRANETLLDNSLLKQILNLNEFKIKV